MKSEQAIELTREEFSDYEIDDLHDDSPYCDCGAVHSIDELDSGQCDCCGKMIEE